MFGCGIFIVNINVFIHMCKHYRILSIDIADATAVLRAGFGWGSGVIHLDDVACTGSETALVNCSYDPITTDCTHYYEDAGVRCSPIRTSGV